MTPKTWRKVVIAEVAALVLMMLAGAAYAGYRYALNRLKTEVTHFIGGDTEIGEIKVSFSSVEISDFRIPGGKNWPGDQLRAKRVTVVPNLRRLLKGKVEAGKIVVEQPYLSIVRTRAGKLRMIPTVLEIPPPDAPPVVVKLVEIRGGSGTLYDYSLGGKPVILKLKSVYVTARNVAYPQLNRKTPFNVKAVVVGPAKNGNANVSGWIVPSTLESEAKTALRGVDIMAFERYLRGAASPFEINKGIMDMDMTSSVHKKVLRANGDITITQLELDHSRHVVKKDAAKLKIEINERIDAPGFTIQGAVVRAVRQTFGAYTGVYVNVKKDDVLQPVEQIVDSIGELFGK